jgi:hypothetical protein
MEICIQFWFQLFLVFWVIRQLFDAESGRLEINVDSRAIFIDKRSEISATSTEKTIEKVKQAVVSCTNGRS